MANAQTGFAGNGVRALSEIAPGNKVKVVGYEGGCHFRQRLSDMGLRIGSDVEILRNAAMGGPVLLGIGSTRLAIGRGMAERVMVRDQDNSGSVDPQNS